MVAFQVSKALSIVAFLIYGLACLRTEALNEEFKRYGLEHLRKLTGGLEVAGALGLTAGYWIPVLDLAASAGLVALMFMAVLTRIRIRDPLVATLPALVLLLINAYILGCAFRDAT